jgi:hypothetical protein
MEAFGRNLRSLRQVVHLFAAIAISLFLFGGVTALANPGETEQAVCAVFRAPIDHLPRRQPHTMLAMRVTARR